MAQKRFPDPHEFLETQIPPELEGWEKMYPIYFLFSRDNEEWEDRQFWYRDGIHAPEPLPPLDHIFQEAWQIALSQNNTRVFCIPPAQGVAHRMVGCYQYICAVEPPPEEVMAEKDKLFKERVPYIVEHYDELWEAWLEKFRALGEEMKRIEVPDLPKYVPSSDVIPKTKGYTPAYELLEAWNHLVNFMFKGWQYHFEYQNLCYLYFLTFADLAKKLFPGISEGTIGKLISGVEAYMFKPQEELTALARQAFVMPMVKEILKKDISASQKIEELKKHEEGRRWLDLLEQSMDPWFYVSVGSGWLHHEGSWITKLDIPFSYLKGYIEALERGETIERSLSEVAEMRERLFEGYKKLIKSDEDRETFEKMYKDALTLYRYAEGHIFWVENWLHTIWFQKVRDFGKVLVKHGVLEDVDDIFMFNRYEVPVILANLGASWALGEGVPTWNWKGEAKRRREILKAAAKWSPPPAFGEPPEVITEPFTIMLWGITTEKVQAWLEAVGVKPEEVTEIKGFAASPGVAEGPARVLLSVDQVAEVQEGEILVCPSTNPSWAPLFRRIKAAVTDVGGVTCHAAIVAREYNLPSVTGTGVATQVIKNGDVIQVDGDNGVVRILKRAGS